MKYATPIVKIHCYRNCVYIYLLKIIVDSKIDIYILKKDNTVLNCCTIAEGKKNRQIFSDIQQITKTVQNSSYKFCINQNQIRLDFFIYKFSKN